MRTTKAAKRERRELRKAKQRRHRRDHGVTLHPLGGTLDPGDLARLTRAFESLDFSAPFATISPMILPVLKRAWHPYPPEMEPVHIQVPPGIPTGFGIDVGPGISHVTPELVERWGVDHATLLGTALENLRALVRTEPPVVDRVEHDGVDLQFVQGQGWGSALVLLPDVLRTIVGTTPRVLVAPVRNTIVTMPADTDPAFVLDVWSALAGGAHDALDLDPLRWTGSAVVAYHDVATRGLPN